jgi:hypothetical protein
MEKLCTRHTELLPKLWDFQKQHFDRRQRIAYLRYESNKCWETQAKLYLDDEETNRSVNNSDIDQNIGYNRSVIIKPRHSYFEQALWLALCYPPLG